MQNAKPAPQERIFPIVMGFWQARALAVAADLGLPDYLLHWILHDWDDAAATAILGCLRRSMKPTARLIVIESVIPEGPAFNLGKRTDLQMLVCVGGRERTETEYRALLSGAGFNLQEVVGTASPLSLLVAKPA